MDSRPNVSIVIPVYNGQETIGPLVDKLVARLGPSYRLEIVLINDCSADRSEDACIAVFEKHPDIVRFFSLAKNVGEHNAVMAGLNQCSGDFVVIMDDDFQNPISEVMKLLNFSLEHDYDVVYTWYRKKHHALWRNLGSWFNDRVANVMLRKPRGLYLSSFKLLNRFLVKEIIKYDLPFSYIDGLILRTTEKIGRLQVEHGAREIGKSGYTLRKLIRLWLNMFVNFSILPLRVATLLGTIFSLIGLGIGVWTVIEKLSNPNLPVGYAALTVIVSIFAGIQLMAVGMNGEYVGRIFLSLNRSPQYTIRRRFEKERDTGNSHAVE
jgi:undecaprenyl-phosphate 4-deoxy-4-formamido-L-arabinose transferase